MLRLIAILVMLLAAGRTACPAYCQENPEQLATLSKSGEVVSVDLVDSALTVKQLKDGASNTYEEVVVPVLPETRIFKGDLTLNLSDLKAGDKVKLEFITDVNGKSKVLNIYLVEA